MRAPQKLILSLLIIYVITSTAGYVIYSLNKADRVTLPAKEVDWSVIPEKETDISKTTPTTTANLKIGIVLISAALVFTIITSIYFTTRLSGTICKLDHTITNVNIGEAKEFHKARGNSEIDKLVNTLNKLVQDFRIKNKQTEDILLKYKIIIDNISDLAYICDANGNIIFVNKVFEKLTGKKPEDFIGKPFIPLFDTDVLEKAVDAYTRRLSGEINPVELRFKSTGKICEYKSIPLRNEKTDIIGVVGIARDITSQKEAQKKAMLAEFFLNHLLDSVFWIRKDARIINANKAAATILGYTKEELMTLTFHTIDKTLKAEYWEKDWELLKEKKHTVFESRHVTKDGIEFPVEITFNYQLFDGDEYNLAFVRDITERKLAEEKLLISEARLKEAQSIAHLGSWIWNMLDDEVEGTEEFFNICGIDKSKLKTFSDSMNTIHKDDNVKVQLFVKELLQNDTGEEVPSGIEHRVTRPDGTERIVYERVKVKYNDKRIPVSLVGTIEDITERSKMQAEILRSQKLESVGVLAGGIAHDFNNILTVILGNTNLAAVHAKSNDKVCNILNNVEKACLRARDLTFQLLTFSKGGEPAKKITSVADLVKESVEIALKGSNVKPEVIIDPDLWTANVDEGQINQVINNLVINAQQAMPEGGILTIKARNINETKSKDIAMLNPGRYISILIKDRGVGIPKNLIPKIFDPYFTTKEKGSGLGLASSYSIIRNHGGIIKVKSEEKKGTTFYVYLAASDAPVHKPTVEKKNNLSGSGRILLMEDEEMIREMVHTMLTTIGYSTVCIRNGDELLSTYKDAANTKKPFDVVIMDLTIPGGMGGKEAIKRLLEFDPTAKSIVYSGYSNDPILANYNEYGFKGVLHKPFVIEEINEVLKEVLNS